MSGSTNARTHQKQRVRLRRKLESIGMPPDQIEHIIAKTRARQLAAREAARAAAAQREQWECETYARLSPDDKGYHPSRPDSVTTGQARATGLAAKAAKRGKTLTRWEYDEALEREGA